MKSANQSVLQDEDLEGLELLKHTIYKNKIHLIYTSLIFSIYLVGGYLSYIQSNYDDTEANTYPQIEAFDVLDLIDISIQILLGVAWGFGLTIVFGIVKTPLKSYFVEKTTGLTYKLFMQIILIFLIAWGIFVIGSLSEFTNFLNFLAISISLFYIFVFLNPDKVFQVVIENKEELKKNTDHLQNWFSGCDFAKIIGKGIVGYLLVLGIIFVVFLGMVLIFGPPVW